jgi:benzoate transport
MSQLQVVAVTMCILLTALDGFDVLSISFAAPGIAAEWGIDRAALGVVLSMELIGMAVGSILIGGLADRVGRRPSILGALVLMTAGMMLAAFARNVYELSAYRLATGLGIGGMLACTSAMAAEFSNLRRRNLAVILMAGGYPLGVILGGSVASWLLASFSWRSVFVLGGLVTAVFIPLTLWLLPESIEHLLQRRPAGALRRINRTLRRMGHEGASALSEAQESAPRPGLAALFSGPMARTTLLLTAAYFAHIMTFYFIIKWIPKLVVDMGYSASMAGGVLVWANVGGIAGCVLIGLLALRYAVKGLVILELLLGAVMVYLFGLGQSGLTGLSVMAAAAGFFTNAAVVGLYALFAQSFPTELRAGGTGFVIGVGRGGSALGPIVAGFLFAAGAGLSTVALLMALGSLLAAVALLGLRVPHTGS